MTLREVRQRFIELSGRFDLNESMANMYISAGQRLLDTLPFSHRNQEAKWNTTLAQGENSISSATIRAIKDVRVETSTGTYYLVKMKLGELREWYGDIDGFPNVDAGAPLYYAPYSLRSVGGAATAATETARGLFIMPPADQDYTVEVRGLFWSEPLEEDDDISYWTEAMPNTLIQAAWYELERFYRNKQGMEDHMAAIERDLRGLDYDSVEEDIAGKDSMKDSWRF